MRQFFLISTVAFTLTVAHGQNLVPNYSFEQYSSCPNNLGEEYLATGWSSYQQSPDYLHTCATNTMVSVPNNFLGYQFPNPSTDSAFFDLATFAAGFDSVREFLGSQLITPLTIGVKYYVSFKASAASNGSSTFQCFTDKIGILFSTISYNVFNPLQVTNFAHVYSSSIIADTINWTNIYGSFVADSTYKYIVIGNFFDDAQTNKSNCTGSFAYYYIDDICVSSDSTGCDMGTGVNEINIATSISIYPNPFSTQTVLQTDNLLHNATLTVDNCFGQTVKEIKNISGQTITFNRGNLASGLYFVRLTEENKTIGTEKLVITD